MKNTYFDLLNKLVYLLILFSLITYFIAPYLTIKYLYFLPDPYLYGFFLGFVLTLLIWIPFYYYNYSFFSPIINNMKELI
mgnify:CR=1 FL=1